MGKHIALLIYSLASRAVISPRSAHGFDGSVGGSLGPNGKGGPRLTWVLPCGWSGGSASQATLMLSNGGGRTAGCEGAWENNGGVNGCTGSQGLTGITGGWG